MSRPRSETSLWTRAQSRLGRRAARPVVLAGLAGTALAIAQAWCIAVVLAAAFGVGMRAAAGEYLAGFALCALLRAMLQLVAERWSFRAGAAARRRLRGEALSRIVQAGPALLRTRHSGELAAAAIDRVEALDGFFGRWLPAARLAIVSPALVALVALWVDPVAGLVLLAAGALVPVGMAFAGIGAAAASRRQFLALSRLQARFLDRVRGIATIVLAGAADAEAAALQRAADELRRRTMRVLRVAFLSSATLDLALAVALVALALRYGEMLRAHTLHAPAQALFVLLLVPEFFAPLRAFSAAYQDKLQAAGAADALVALPAPAPPAPVPAGPVRTVAAQGVTVAFEAVGMTWDEARGPALRNLSFRLRAGETLVLAGPSGAGKSTVLEILLGFARPQLGRVTLNGAPIESIVPQALAEMTAWIGQRPLLFAGTLRENIRFARPEASEAEFARAVRAARLDDVAAALPQGYDTRLGEAGHGLSGGQAQRVAIARAFLKDAKLLLLDEPTSHLDPATEADVMESLARLATGRTVVLATHSAAAQALRGAQFLQHPPRSRSAAPGRGGSAGVRPLGRILGLWRGRAGWLVAGLVLALGALLAGVGLLTVAGAWIGSVVAGVALAAPLLLRALGLARVVLRYAERLVTHDATFRALADLRVWFFRGLARHSAGGLGFPAGGRRAVAAGRRRGSAGRALSADHRAACRRAAAAAGAAGGDRARRPAARASGGVAPRRLRLPAAGARRACRARRPGRAPPLPLAACASPRSTWSAGCARCAPSAPRGACSPRCRRARLSFSAPRSGSPGAPAWPAPAPSSAVRPPCSRCWRRPAGTPNGTSPPPSW